MPGPGMPKLVYYVNIMGFMKRIDEEYDIEKSCQVRSYLLA